MWSLWKDGSTALEMVAWPSGRVGQTSISAPVSVPTPGAHRSLFLRVMAPTLPWLQDDSWGHFLDRSRSQPSDVQAQTSPRR